MIKYEIKNRFTDEVQLVAEIDCPDYEEEPVKLRLAVLWALKNKANLRGANLSGGDFSGVDFSGVDLSEVNFSGADLSEANFTKTPTIKNIHQAVAAAVQGGRKLDMDYWHHECGTKHCRAGWVVTIAGEAGAKLERELGASAAAALIYMNSDPNMEKVPDFHCSDEEALADILRCAEREKEENVE